MSIIVFNTPWPQPSAPSLLWFVVAGQPLCVRSAVRGFGLIPERDAISALRATTAARRRCLPLSTV